MPPSPVEGWLCRGISFVCTICHGPQAGEEAFSVRIHLDTDLGGDPDDLCAMALLLSWPDVAITGITTTSDYGGRRAAYVHEALSLAGRPDIAVAAGPDSQVPGVRYPVDFLDDTRYWGRPIDETPPSGITAIDVLDASVRAGAAIVGIGPLTNLAAYDIARPGRLDTVPFVVMGGFTRPLGAGWPDWDIDADWNLQYDVRASEHVLRRLHPTLVPIEATVRTGITRRDTARLDGAGAVPSLMARQAQAYFEDQGGANRFAEFAAAPWDLLNFHHDPLACAVALGWDGVSIDEVALGLELRDTYLSTRKKAGGKTLPVVTEVEGDAFDRLWIDRILQGPLATG
jgi:purine nucleosidase